MLKLSAANLKGDLFGGITAGVVALPLALAMGVASGLGPIAGLYGAIFVGFFAALFGGTESQVSGPTGPMTVVVAGLAASLAAAAGEADKLGLIFTAIMLGGLMQIALGVMRMGEYIRLVPYPVISGFMSGIGGIIVILQIGPLLGHASPPGTVDALLAAPSAAADTNFMALVIGLSSFAIAMTWPRQLAKYLPGPLAALIIGTGLSLALGGVPILGDIPSGLPSLHLPQFSGDTIGLVLEAAFILALLGSIDSLLTSLVADNLTRSRHDSNQELIGQGIGNTFAGLFGGTAGAGATMRTVINIRTGGKTRISGMVHALFLLAVVLGLGSLASYIPHAALGGILIKVGVDIVDWTYLKNAHRGPRWDLVLMVLVLLLTIFVDLITAVAVGVVLAAIAFVEQVAKDQMKNLKSRDALVTASPRARALLQQLGTRVSVFEFRGPLSFGAAADLGHHARSLFRDEQLQALILDFSNVPFLDVSAIRAVETIADDAAHNGRALHVCGMTQTVRDSLSALDADRHLYDFNYHDDLETALEAVQRAIDSGRLVPAKT
ncbi:MAG: SulP family inorganic anion transporter [Gammaproteobacteria bacterium]